MDPTRFSFGLGIGAPLAGVVWVLSAGFFAACDSADGGIYPSSVERGGALYDKYWLVTGDEAPSGENRLWARRPDKESNQRSGPDTWRCKECHGWDYRGEEGEYGQGGHRTGIRGIVGTNLDEDELIKELRDDHGYGDAGVSTPDLRDLAAFVREAAGEVTNAIDNQGKFRGDADQGQTIYRRICQQCHGQDGLNERPQGSVGNFQEFPGKLAQESPWEFLHKVRFGHPGTPMPPQNQALSANELADLGAHAQTLPSSKD